MAVQEQVFFVPTPDVVANAFARQYYTILHQSPVSVHRFYQNMSKLSRIEDDGGMSTTTTLTAIDEKIQSYGRLKADIKFVDAQQSYNGGVIVLVTGSMVNEDDSRHGFTQTFFLAPQDKGYFVLNDIFRYLEDEVLVNQEDAKAPVIHTEEVTIPVQENHNSEPSNGEVYNPLDNGEVSMDEGEEEEKEPVAEVADEALHEPQVAVESNVKAQGAEKKSYASIVMKDAPASPPSPNLLKSVPKLQQQQVPVAFSAALSPAAVAPTSSTNNNDRLQERQGDCYSIYLRNLPMDASYVLIEEEFKRFGPIKSGGIQIRSNKGFYFGFVEFDVASAVQSAIEASPISIGGHEVVIEEKKSTNSRGNNHGRFPVRGSGFRGDGGRGRSSYGGGRGGFGQGESNRGDFGRRGSSRGYQNQGGEGYQRNDQMGYGGGRGNRGGGSGFGSARAHRVPQPT